MKSAVRTLFVAVSLFLSLLPGFSGNGTGPKPFINSTPTESRSFDDVIQAHGGREALAKITAFYAEAVRLTPTSPTAFFERRVKVSSEGAKFRRYTVDPSGIRQQVEIFDGVSGFYASAFSKDENSLLSTEPATTDYDREQAVRFSIKTFGLLPMIQACASEETKASFLGRVQNALDKFTVRVSGNEWIVYADQSHLIRQIEIEGRLFQFAHYRSVDGLRLPFIQRVSLGKRPVYELAFSMIDLDPSFEPHRFDPSSIGAYLNR